MKNPFVEDVNLWDSSERFGMRSSKLKTFSGILFCMAFALFISACVEGSYDQGIPKVLMTKGQARFEVACTGCHEFDAKGHPGSIPSLYHSDFLMADRHRPIRIQLLGLPNAVDTATTIIVNSDSFSDTIRTNPMPNVGYCSSDSEIAAVLTYVRATFNNATDYIKVEEVAQVRDSLLKANLLDTIAAKTQCLAN